jgi:hypothetical protein
MKKEQRSRGNNIWTMMKWFYNLVVYLMVVLFDQEEEKEEG